MGHKIIAGCGIREILRTGCGMKMSWRDRDALISTGGMWYSFEIDSGMRDFKASDPIGIKILKVAGWRVES